MRREYGIASREHPRAAGTGAHAGSGTTPSRTCRGLRGVQGRLFPLAVLAGALFGLVVVPPAVEAARVEQTVVFSTEGQSLWDTGPAATLGFNDFFGIDWNFAGQVGDAVPGTNSLEVAASTAGRIGVDTALGFDSGSFSAQLPYSVGYDFAQGTFNVGDRVAISTFARQNPLSRFQSNFSDFQASADLIVTANAHVSAGGCVNVLIVNDCGNVDIFNASVNQNIELAAINRNGDGQIRLGGSTIGTPIDLNGTTQVVLKPGGIQAEGLGGSFGVGLVDPLIAASFQLPDIDLSGNPLAGSPVLVAPKQEQKVLELNFDVDGLVAEQAIKAGIPFALAGNANVSILGGLASVDASVDLVDVDFRPALFLGQQLSLEPTVMTTLAFDRPTDVELANGTTQLDVNAVTVRAGDALNILWDGAPVGIAPTYNLQADLVNVTTLRVEPIIGVDFVSAGLDVGVFGNTIVDANVGPLFSVQANPASLLPPEVSNLEFSLLDKRFAVQGFTTDTSFDQTDFLLQSGGRVWDNSVDNGNFSNPANWIGGQVPDGGDSVVVITADPDVNVIDLKGVSVASGTRTIGNLTMIGNNTLNLSRDEFTFNLGSTQITQRTTGKLTVEGGLVILDGSTINVNAGFGVTVGNRNQIVFANPSGTVITATEGRGSIVLNGGHSSAIDIGTVLVNETTDISGAGIIDSSTGAGRLVLGFNGSVTAKKKGLEDFLILDQITVENSGVLRADSGARLIFVGGAIRAPNNNGPLFAQTGIIEALDGGGVELSQGTQLESGILRTQGTGLIRNIGSARLIGSLPDASGQLPLGGSAIINEGQFIADAGTSTEIEGVIVNNANMRFDSSTTKGATSVAFTQGAFQGTGTVSLTGDHAGGVSITGNTLVNGAGHTVEGTATVNLTGGLTNFGNWNANDANGTRFSTDVLNEGTITASNNTLLLFDQGLANYSGLVEAVGGGRVVVDAAGIDFGSTGRTGTDVFNLSAGRIRVAGPGSEFIIRNAGIGSGIFNLSADLTLEGAGSAVRVVSGGDINAASPDIEDTLNTVVGGGALRILAGRDYNASGTPLVNFGEVELGGGTLTTSFFGNGNTGRLFGDGAIVTGLLLNEGGTIHTDGVLDLRATTLEVLNGGIVEAHDGLINTAGATDVSNLANNTLTGGVWRVIDTDGLLSRINLGEAGQTIDTLAADVTLSGSASRLVTQGTTNIDGSLTRIAQGGVLRLKNGRDFRADSGSLVNDGRITMDQVTISADAAHLLTNGDPGTISGRGTLRGLGAGTVALHNRGNIIADNEVFTIRDLEIDNAGGTITARDGVSFALDDAIIRNGNFTVDAGAIVRASGAVRVDGKLANNGVIETTAATDVLDLNLSGLPFNANTGEIRARAGNIRLSGNSLLNRVGTIDGTVRVDQGATVSLLGTSIIGGAVVVDGTLRATGDGGHPVLAGDVALTNRGLIEVSSGGFLTVDTAGTSFTNNGRFGVAAGAAVQFQDDLFINRGTVETLGGGAPFFGSVFAKTYRQEAGATIVNGRFFADTIDILGGTFTGSGDVFGNVNVGTGAILSAGNSPGVDNVFGDVVIGALGTLLVELGGVDAFDQLNVFDNTRTAIVDGAVSLAVDAVIEVLLTTDPANPGAGTFDPLAGLFFDILTADAGMFNFALSDLRFVFPTFGDDRFFAASFADLGNGREALRLSVTRPAPPPPPPTPGPSTAPEPRTVWLLALGLALLLALGRRLPANGRVRANR